MVYSEQRREALCCVSKFAENVDIFGDLFSGTKEAADRFVTPF